MPRVKCAERGCRDNQGGYCSACYIELERTIREFGVLSCRQFSRKDKKEGL